MSVLGVVRSQFGLLGCQRVYRSLQSGIVFLVVCFAGCSLTSQTLPPPEAVVASEAIGIAHGSKPETTPFVLEVLDEVNDGQRLLIKGRLSSKSSWPTDDIVLRLSALDDRGESRVLLNRLTDLLPEVKVLSSDSPASFTLAMASAGLASYQLEVLWGADAAPFKASGNPSGMAAPKVQQLILRGLEVHRLPDSSCATPDECRVKFTITGEFFNSGQATVKEVALLAGFSDADRLDLQDQFLNNEREVEVRNMRLAPGEAKPFRLALETLVPPSQQMAPRPVIRILSVKTE